MRCKTEHDLYSLCQYAICSLLKFAHLYINLCCRMSETPGVMGQMRPLPEPVNEGQLNSLLQLDRVVSSKLVVCRIRT